MSAVSFLLSAVFLLLDALNIMSTGSFRLSVPLFPSQLL
jgi:hypothetical protein